MCVYREKLKRTEEDIARCKQKIEELSKQKTVTQTTGSEFKSESIEAKGQEDTAGRNKFKQRMQDLNSKSTPWATHHNVKSDLIFSNI